MDDKSTQLLQEILNQQKLQTQLLQKHLWRFRFSLLSLLLLTTATAIGLGIMAYKQQQPAITPLPPPATAWTSYPPNQFQPYSAPAQKYEDASLPQPK